MDSLPHLMADVPGAQWLGSWSGEAGQYVVIGGQAPDTITQLVENCGLVVDSVERLRRRPFRRDSVARLDEFVGPKC